MTDRKDIKIRCARAADAEEISGVIIDSLRSTNARDYPPDIIDRVAEKFSPSCISDLVQKREVFVAVLGPRIVGTASLDGDVILTVFVAPDFQNMGIGRKLIKEVELRARAKGIALLKVPSSITAERFYGKLGFVAVRDSYDGDERTIIMERHL